MKTLDMIAKIILGCIALSYIGFELVSPYPFISTAERETLEPYKKVAYRLKSKVILDTNKFPTRASLVADLLSTKFYTLEQISFLADDECLNGNKLFKDGIVFWRSGENTVLYVDRNYNCYMKTKKDFAKLLK